MPAPHPVPGTVPSALACVLPVVLAVVLAASCGGSDASSSSPTEAGGSAPKITQPAAERRPRSDRPGGVEVTTQDVPAIAKGVPVSKGNFADPFLLVVGDEVYGYATNVADANIPAIRSVSNTTAEYLGDAMPTVPRWTSPGAVWAPSVYARGDGTYVMFFSSRADLEGHQCIGRAVARDPAGPFVDDTDKAFVCPESLGGAIDPSMISIDGAPWLIYKSDGNCCDLPTTIWSVPLSSDLLGVAGEPTSLISDDQPWEAGVVEAPEMIEVGGQLYLFYSGNRWNTADYAVGYATCQAVTGPCTKPRSEALFASTDEVAGPGGQTFVLGGASDDEAAIGYHGWLPGQVGGADGARQLYARVMSFAGGEPRIISGP